jgi:hypothetical protein
VTTGWLSMITPVPSTNPQSGPARRRPALDLRYRVINTPITEPQRQSARRARRSDTPQASEGTFAARIRHQRVTRWFRWSPVACSCCAAESSADIDCPSFGGISSVGNVEPSEFSPQSGEAEGVSSCGHGQTVSQP